jgi:uncharacterized protein (TIGR04255 family)
MKNPVPLPTFSKPPLTEVVLSLQFASLGNLKGLHLGLFWKKFRKEYPDVSEMHPIQTVFEKFGVPQSAPAFQLEAFMTPPMPRYWFEKKGTPDLLQIQHDRLVHNWRIADGSSDYPRYHRVKAKFEKELLAFSNWLESENLGQIIPNQCEVTYTNLIDDGTPEFLHSSLSRFTPLLTDEITEDMPSQLEDVTANSRFIFFRDQKPAGRVYVQFQPVFRQTDLRPAIKLEITARGKPDGETLSDALSFLDFEHEQVVKTFVAVTTEEMHKVWGRVDGKRSK